jgi:hypothetical protein
VKSPIIVKNDNVSTTVMSGYASTGVRTRDVDKRYYVVREFIEDGFVKVDFVRSVENDSDLIMK